MIHLRAALFATISLFSIMSHAADDRIAGSLFLDNPEEAARQAAPFWFFGRSFGRSPCYPEGAVNSAGDGPNPGTNTPISMEPGDDCLSPGDWQGTYTHGNSFPTYWVATYCNDDSSWRINYNLYFPHDGMLSNGHKNDWEWAAVKWTKCDEANDMWCRDRLMLSFHTTNHQYAWGDIQNTINSPDEIRNLGDKNKHHPLVYVGAFKHAMFQDRKTSMNVIGADDLEFRSNDWWYFSADDLVRGDTIHQDWDYGSATSNPLQTASGICGM